ncbi:MAG: hypothetical protein AAGD00_01270 [Planctomycetota bacterium]
MASSVGRDEREALMDGASTPKKKGGGLRRLLVGLVVVVLLLLTAVVVGLPIAANSAGPGLIKQAIEQRVNGTADVGSLKVSWLGSQEVRDVVITDAQGRTVLNATATIDRGIVGLLTSAGDLGTITLTGDAVLYQEADGSNTTRTVMKPSAGAPAPASTPGEPISLPALQARVELSGFDVTIDRTGAGGESRTLNDLEGQAVYDGASGAITVSLDGTSAGIGTLDAYAADLRDASGALDLTAATGTIEGDLTIPEWVTGALTGARGAGEDSSLTINGSLAQGVLTLDPTSSARLVLPAGALSGLVEFDPSAGVTLIDDAPTVAQLDVSSLAIPVGSIVASGVQGADWRAMNSTIEASVTGLGAMVQPMRQGTANPVRVTLPELRGALAWDASSSPLRVEVLGDVLRDGVQSGSLQLQGEGVDLLDEGGRLPSEGVRGRFAGLLKAERVPMALVEAIGPETGIDLVGVIGDEASLLATARTGAEGTDETGVQFTLAGARSALVGVLGINGDRITTPNVASSAMSQHLPMTDLWNVLDTGDPAQSRRGVALRASADSVRTLAGEALAGSGVDLGTGDVTLHLDAMDLPMPNGEPALDELMLRLDVIASGGAPSGSGGTRVSLDPSRVITRIDPGGRAQARLEIAGDVDGESMTVNGDLALPGLFVADTSAFGGLRVEPASVRPEGAVTVAGVPTALAGANADLLRDLIGDTVNANFTATTDAQNVTNVEFVGGGARADLTGALALADDEIRGTRAITLSAREPRAAIGSLIAASGASVRSASAITVSIDELRVPTEAIRSGDALALAGGASGVVRAQADRLDLRVESDGQATSAGIAGLDLTLDLRDAAQATLRGGFTATSDKGSAPATVDVVASRAALLQTPINPEALGLRGTIALTDVPSALAALVAPEYAALAQEAAGESFTLKATLPASGATEPVSVDVTLTAASGLAADARATATRELLSIGPATMRGSVTPRLVTLASETFLAESGLRPSLSPATRFSANLEPIRISADESGAFSASEMSRWGLFVRTEDPFVVENLPALDEGKTSRVGVTSAVYALRVHPRRSRDSNSSVSLELFEPSRPGSDIGEVSITQGMGSRGGSLTINANLPDTAALDRMIGREGFLAGALGENVTIDVARRNATDYGDGGLDVSVRAPRLTASAAGFETQERMLTSTKELNASWRLEPAFANRYLLGPDADATLAEGVTVELHAPSFLVPTGASPAGGNTPRELGGDLRVSTGPLKLTSRSGQTAEILGMNVRARHVAGASPGTLTLEGAVLERGAGGESNAAVTLAGELRGTTNAQGIAPASAWTYDATLKGSLATVIVDALAGMESLLRDGLGDRVAVDVRANDFSTTSGSLDATLTSDKADLVLQGNGEGGRLVQRGEVRATVSQISSAFSRRFISTAIPIFDTFEKTASNEPAFFTLTNGTIPLDGDMTKFNGDAVVDLGSVTFQTSPWLGGILAVADANAMGRAGERLQPIPMKIRNGIITYENAVIPTGSVELEIDGTVNLVNGDRDFYLFVPLQSVNKDFSRAIEQIPGIRKIARLPFRVKRRDGKTEYELDFDRLGEAAAKSLIETPEDIVESVFDLIGGGGNRK